MPSPQHIFDRIVTIDNVRAHRDRTGDSMLSCKAKLVQQALLEILADSDCSPGVRFVLEHLIQETQ